MTLPVFTSSGGTIIPQAPPDTPPIPASVPNDETVQANKTQAAKLGVTLPGPTSETLAQNQARVANVGKPGYDTFGNPTGQTDTLQQQRQAGGTFTATDGKKYYSFDSSPVSVSTQGTQNGTSNLDTGSPLLSDQTDRSALAQAQQDYQNTATQVQTTIANIQNGVTPLTAGEQAQIAGLQQQFDTLIKQQQQSNTQAAGAGQIRGYQAGAAEYDPTFQVKTIGSIVSAGAAKVADLQIKEASAVAALTQSFKDKDIAAVKDAWDIYNQASKERTDALQKTITDTAAAIKDAQTAKIAADKVVYDTVTKPIQDIGLKAAEMGASADTLAKIRGASTVDEAISAAGTSIQSSTNPDIAQYLFYKQQADQAGVVPQTFESWKSAQDKKEVSLAYSKAYATAAGSAAAQADASGITTSPIPQGLGGTSGGGSILSATGLSIAAFNFLTQGTPSMSRMPAGQRNAIMKEAEQYLNRTGTDISTFQAQYKAYNDVLTKNISRANQTKIMAGEVSGSADSLISVIEQHGTAGSNDPFNPLTKGSQGMSSLKAANVLDLMAGKETNNKFAQQYATQIRFMANDLAGYMAAARGATSPELQDQRDAATIIANGMNKGSVQAFKDSVNANEEKVAQVVNGAVEAAQKQVWGIFGVGDKYKVPVNAGDAQIQEQKQDDSVVQQKIVSAATKDPKIASTVQTLLSSGRSYTDIAQMFPDLVQ